MTNLLGLIHDDRAIKLWLVSDISRRKYALCPISWRGRTQKRYALCPIREVCLIHWLSLQTRLVFSKMYAIWESMPLQEYALWEVRLYMIFNPFLYRILDNNALRVLAASQASKIPLASPHAPSFVKQLRLEFNVHGITRKRRITSHKIHQEKLNCVCSGKECPER